MIMNALDTMPHFTCTFGESAGYPPRPPHTLINEPMKKTYESQREKKMKKGRK